MRTLRWLFLAVTVAAPAASHAASPVAVDLSRYSSTCGIDIRHDRDRITARWPMERGGFGSLILTLDAGEPLIESFGIAASLNGRATPILQNAEALTAITVGTRQAPAGRPPEMSIWNSFFDRPASRPYQTYATRLERKRVRVTSEGKRATIALGDLSIGPFSGELQVTLYSGSRLIHAEAVVATQEDRCAIVYDAGLLPHAGVHAIAWMDTEGRMQSAPLDGQANVRPVAVRHRAIIAGGDSGSVACFPPPHQFHFPRDWTDNLKFAWYGGRGFGIRQEPDGKRAFEPWFNSPPGTQQRLGVFYLLTRGKAEDALRETLRYTHGDRFVPLPGHITFTGHYHMAVGVNALTPTTALPPVGGGSGRGLNDEYARVFRDMGVNAVHLGDFHGDGHQRDPGPLRLPEMESMFNECKRLSTPDFLMIPGEELSGILGVDEPGKHPGHWMSLFPKPVYFTQVRAPEQPLVEQLPKYGTVYHAGSRQDMVELLKREHGLAWTAHPRIKASSWTPDIFRNEDFFLADFWLGGAWKAMPADLSRERLGERVLDLLNDMSNWSVTPPPTLPRNGGGRMQNARVSESKKYTPGEVDVFKIDHTHELYGHMNINYLRLPRVPHYDEGWQPILDALRSGKFFVTTGEVLIRDFTVNGKQSGETLTPLTLRPLPPGGGERDGVRGVELKVDLEWTFPLRFAEVITGDGKNVYRERIDLSDTMAFGRRTLTLRPDLRGNPKDSPRKWVRFEVWDVATNGAFTQPIWLRS